MTKEEIKKIFEYLEDKKDYRGAALVALFYSSGCRLTELWQQNRDSLDLEERQFKVLGQGQKERICIFSDDAKQKVLRYINSRKDNLKPLFISRQNNRWSRKAIQDFVKEIGKRVGVETNVHPHMFRHTIAMHLLQDGYKLEEIQLVMGHENISTTQAYAHSNIQSVQGKIDEFYN